MHFDYLDEDPLRCMIIVATIRKYMEDILSVLSGELAGTTTASKQRSLRYDNPLFAHEITQKITHELR